jgi:HicA toxin of bacterial toxin-antitoxin,
MRTITGREFARLIERRGWQLLRINGSHHIYGKPGSGDLRRASCGMMWAQKAKEPVLARIARGAPSGSLR